MKKLKTYIESAGAIITPANVASIVLGMSREECIDFLVLADPYGINTDAQCMTEGIPRLTDVEVHIMCMESVWQQSIQLL